MSDEIMTALEDGLETVAAKVKTGHDELQSQITDLAQQAGGAEYAKLMSGGAPSPLAKLASHDEVNRLRSGATKSVRLPLDIDVKTLVGALGDSNSDPWSVDAHRGSVIGEDARRPLRLLDVMPRILVSSGSFEYIRLDGFTNSADVQDTEADTKAVQEIATTLQTSTIATVAVTLDASEQVLADVAQLGNFLQSKLRYAVLQKLESELLAGSGASGYISGLVNQATAADNAADASPVDRLGAAIATLEISGWVPSAILLHPSDWFDIRSQRESSGSGAYLAGSWAQPVGPNVWGVPVIVSAALSQGTSYVLDASQTALLDRQSAVVELGYNGTGFAQNVLTFRAELRAGLAVFSPTAVLSVELVGS